MKDTIATKSISARQVFDLLAKLDPEFHFGFTEIAQLDELVKFLGVKLEPHELIFVCTYFYSNLFIRYFKILQRVFPPKELIDNIIIKAVEATDSFKDFFEAQTNGRPLWKTE